MAEFIKNTVVFDLKSETFTKFEGVNLLEAYPLSYGELQDNYLLMLTDGGEVLAYPGGNYTENPAELRTREIYMRDGILKYVRAYFEGEDTQILTRVKDPYFPSHWKEDLITSPESGKKIGIKNAKCRGESFSIEIQDAEVIQKVGWIYQIKGEI